MAGDPFVTGELDFQAGSLDAAWAEAEAALPIGWVLDGLERWDGWDGGWLAYAIPALRPNDSVEGIGPTPTAALQALTAKLRETP